MIMQTLSGFPFGLTVYTACATEITCRKHRNRPEACANIECWMINYCLQNDYLIRINEEFLTDFILNQINMCCLSALAGGPKYSVNNHPIWTDIMIYVDCSCSNMIILSLTYYKQILYIYSTTLMDVKVRRKELN